MFYKFLFSFGCLFNSAPSYVSFHINRSVWHESAVCVRRYLRRTMELRAHVLSVSFLFNVSFLFTMSLFTYMGLFRRESVVCVQMNVFDDKIVCACFTSLSYSSLLKVSIICHFWNKYVCFEANQLCVCREPAVCVQMNVFDHKVVCTCFTNLFYQSIWHVSFMSLLEYIGLFWRESAVCEQMTVSDTEASCTRAMWWVRGRWDALATLCHTLQHTVTYCNTLQYTTISDTEASCTRAMWRVRGRWDTLQHTATHCNTLQHTATLYNTLQFRIQGPRAPARYGGWDGMHCNTLSHTATHCNKLQHNI